MSEIKTSALKNWLSEINIPVYILVALFAISSWIDLNGMWVQLPILVRVLPEGWDLPSYITIIIQIANIGAISYTLLNRKFPHVVNEPPAVAVIIVVGAISCLMLAFFWNVTTYIGGVLHSTAFFIMAALLSLVDCTSSVVYLPYMAAFKPQYMTALYIGESMSGMVPGIVGLIQGASDNPVCVNTSYLVNSTTNETAVRLEPVYSPPFFSVEVFFFILFAIMVVSGLSFCLLHHLPMCKNERTLCTNVQGSLLNDDSGSLENEKNKTVYKHYGSIDSELNSKADMVGSKIIIIEEISLFSNNSTTILMVFIVWLNCITNGMMPALQTYAVLPYGNSAYSFAVILAIISSPLGSFVALFLRCRSMLSVNILMASGSLFAFYNFFLATQSPAPPLVGETSGEVLAVSSWILMSGIFAFTKVTIASILRYKGRKALLWCGIFTQTGAFIGAIISFLLVNVLHLFHSKPAC